MTQKQAQQNKTTQQSMDALPTTCSLESHGAEMSNTGAMGNTTKLSALHGAAGATNATQQRMCDLPSFVVWWG